MNDMNETVLSRFKKCIFMSQAITFTLGLKPDTLWPWYINNYFCFTVDFYEIIIFDLIFKLICQVVLPNIWHLWEIYKNYQFENDVLSYQKNDTRYLDSIGEY